MRNSLWFASIFLIVMMMPSSLSQPNEQDGNEITTTGLARLQWNENEEWVQDVPAAQAATPEPTETPEVPYPIEPGTSPLGIIIGAVIIVLTVLSGVAYASLVRRKN